MVRDRILRMSVTDYLKNEGARLLGGGGGEVRLLGIIRRCRPTAGLSLIGMKKSNVGLPSMRMAQLWSKIGWMSRVRCS